MKQFNLFPVARGIVAIIHSQYEDTSRNTSSVGDMYRNTSSVGDMHRNTSSVEDMLNDLNWQTLEIRRKNQRLTMMYKIHNNLVEIDKDNFLEEKRRILPSHTHCYQYQIPVCTKDYHYYSFFPRATREWNKLSDAVHATTVEAFKAKLSTAAATDN